MLERVPTTDGSQDGHAMMKSAIIRRSFAKTELVSQTLMFISFLVCFQKKPRESRNARIKLLPSDLPVLDIIVTI